MKGIGLGLLLLLFAAPAGAYGPRSVTTSGTAVKWSLPVPVDYESDFDVRGTDVTALVNEGLSQWTDLSESNVTFSKRALGAAVDADNVCCYLYDSAACPSGPTDDGINPIVIDDDGLITAKFFGSANRYTTLGFAAVVSYQTSSGTAVKGEAVFNAACLSGVELSGCGSLSFSNDDFISFIVHEMGHFLGLNHAQVNLDEAEDSDTSNDDDITTMYSFFIQGNGANFKTPERDDEIGMAVLYPETTFSTSTFTVTGTVRDEDGTDPFPCANVIARNTTASLSRTDAASYISGQMCAGGSFNGSCDGTYTIQGLDPAQSYSVEVEPIDSSFRGSSGIIPCDSSSEQPTFDTQTHGDTQNESAGATSSDVNFTLTNTSGNVGALTLAPLDSPLVLQVDSPWADEAVAALEFKTATEACSNSDASGGGGCSLVPQGR